MFFILIEAILILFASVYCFTYGIHQISLKNIPGAVIIFLISVTAFSLSLLRIFSEFFFSISF